MIEAKMKSLDVELKRIWLRPNSKYFCDQLTKNIFKLLIFLKFLTLNLWKD